MRWMGECIEIRTTLFGYSAVEQQRRKKESGYIYMLCFSGLGIYFLLKAHERERERERVSE